MLFCVSDEMHLPLQLVDKVMPYSPCSNLDGYEMQYMQLVVHHDQQQSQLII